MSTTVAEPSGGHAALIDWLVPPDGPDALTARELAGALKMSVTHVFRLSRSGSLPAPLRLGPRKSVFSRAAVRQALARLSAEGKAR